MLATVLEDTPSSATTSAMAVRPGGLEKGIRLHFFVLPYHYFPMWEDHLEGFVTTNCYYLSHGDACPPTLIPVTYPAFVFRLYIPGKPIAKGSLDDPQQRPLPRLQPPRSPNLDAHAKTLAISENNRMIKAAPRADQFPYSWPCEFGPVHLRPPSQLPGRATHRQRRRRERRRHRQTPTGFGDALQKISGRRHHRRRQTDPALA